MKRILIVGAIAVSIVGIVGERSSGQEATRTIYLNDHVPIADRLMAGDVRVVVKRLPTTPLVANPAVRETFEEEAHRLGSYDTIAVVNISEAQGQITEDGTWIRNRIRGRAIKLIKSGTLVDSNGFVEFWDDGGRTELGSVIVTAEPYIEFTVQQDYLLFLRTDRNRGNTYVALAFHVDPQSIVRALKRTDGTAINPNSNLIRRSTSEVAVAFSK